MSELPATLTYFGNMQKIGQVLNRCALPAVSAQNLFDPFLPHEHSAMPFSSEGLVESATKYIVQAILGKSPPRGQPNHPLQKAVNRWRAENRFNSDAEIKEALKGLLPTMVEKVYSEAMEMHNQWLDYANSKRIIPLFENYQSLNLWQLLAHSHKGVAIRFRCEASSVFKDAKPVVYSSQPAKTVSISEFTEYMVGNRGPVSLRPELIVLNQNSAYRKLKEWRLILDSTQESEQWLTFEPDVIQSVYIGALVPEKTVSQLQKHLHKMNPAISVYRSRTAEHEYALEFEKLESLTESSDDSKADDSVEGG
ncbi:hypothetical protein [Aliikangiella sp. G2MR2-5]|uniref:hypothetical protein n=1 Tax=Aliikangiella sp. G2MR2-5 TaxID=2788943 RepID=UPI0018AAF2BD|nr:hypothetical protein [Aliikangiella sp. G2MR2-5]